MSVKIIRAAMLGRFPGRLHARPAEGGRERTGRRALATLAIAASTLALTAPIAAPMEAPGAARGADRAHWVALAVAFAVLAGGMLMPALVHAARGLLRSSWAFVKLEVRIALHELVVWLLLAGAASLGLLHYLQWLPAFR